MFEEKESWWKSKGFYFSACVLLVGVMAAGVIFYQKSGKNGADKMLAEIATEMPESTPAGNDASKEQSAQANANITPMPTAVSTPGKTPKQIAKEEAKKARAEAKEKAEKAKREAAEKLAAQKAKSREAKPASANAAKKYTFNEEKGLLWPVKGDVLMKYSMSKTIYFKTLAQYKYNPGLVIGAKEGAGVKAAASGRVVSVTKDDELGQMVTMEIGDEYTVIYGQLKDVSVKKGDDVKEGQSIGKIAKPTKYYAEEGSNLYFQVKEGKETVDPMLLLR